MPFTVSPGPPGMEAPGGHPRFHKAWLVFSGGSHDAVSQTSQRQEGGSAWLRPHHHPGRRVCSAPCQAAYSGSVSVAGSCHLRCPHGFHPSPPPTIPHPGSQIPPLPISTLIKM